MAGAGVGLCGTRSLASHLKGSKFSCNPFPHNTKHPQPPRKKYRPPIYKNIGSLVLGICFWRLGVLSIREKGVCLGHV